MSTNVSKQKRDELIAKIGAIRHFISSAPQDENTGNLLTYLAELEKDVNGKKYGLVFEEHCEEIDKMLETHTPVLNEEKDLFISNGGQMNFLMEGDNLASLTILEKTHKGKIDLIYIDPPYNTGNKDFIYDDAFVDKTDLFSHSKWLSFMSERLLIAKRLLSKNGAIFISIDDKEEAGLKLLCDSIFGENCFAANISWQRTYSIRNDSKGIPLEVEHILVYSKQENWQPNKLPRTAKMNASYKNPDGDRCAWMSGSPIASDAKTHQGMVYGIQHPLTGKMLYPNHTAHWRYSQEQMLEYMNGWCGYKLEDLHDDEKRAEICGVPVEEVRKNVKAIVLEKPFEQSYPIAKKVFDNGPWPRFYFTSGGKGGIRRKVYADSVGGRITTNYWMYDEVGHTDEAKKELKSIFEGNIPFDTPKPIRLLERILQIASNNDSIVLDFFAGSGSTGHAVMNYNKANLNSNRRFILCTNNENNICRNVTYERLKRVIHKESYGASLKYYKVVYVPVSDRLYYEYADELLNYVRELVELENGIHIKGNPEVLIILTEEEFDEFMEHIDEHTKYHKLYLGHDILMDAQQAQILKDRNITINIIPDYYDKELEV